MIKQLKCMLVGHSYLMGYDNLTMRYNIQPHDKCTCCNKVRGRGDRLSFDFRAREYRRMNAFRFQL